MLKLAKSEFFIRAERIFVAAARRTTSASSEFNARDGQVAQRLSTVVDELDRPFQVVTNSGLGKLRG